MVFLGYLSVLQALAYALLTHFNLLSFSPVVDELVRAVSSTAAVGGAVALHKSVPSR